jgi:hypothetical protein
MYRSTIATIYWYGISKVHLMTPVKEGVSGHHHCDHRCHHGMIGSLED